MKKIYFLSGLLFSGLFAYSQNHTITIHKNDRVASLLMTPSEFKHWNDSDDYQNNDKRTAIVQDIYKKFKDDFDFIFLVYNNYTRPANLSYAGLLIGVSNSVIGTGVGVYSNSSFYGSAGKLKSVMALSKYTDLLYGPSLHELMHNWANFNIHTTCFDPYGPGSGSFDFIPHWGFSGCGGQLGGFDQSTLVGNVGGNPNQYTVGINGHAGFGQFANGGNGLPYSNYELYLAGMIPPDSITPFDVFNNVSAYNNTTGTFTATTKTTYTKSKIESDFGVRNPPFSSSQKSFRLLIMVLTAAPLSDSLWTAFDGQAEQFARPSSDGTTLFNFWEATRSRGTLNVGNLSGSVGIREEAQNKLKALEIYPNPVQGVATLHLESTEAGLINYEVLDNIGKLVLNDHVNISPGVNTIKIDFSGMSNGLYFIQLYDQQSRIMKKVLVGN